MRSVILSKWHIVIWINPNPWANWTFNGDFSIRNPAFIRSLIHDGKIQVKSRAVVAIFDDSNRSDILSLAQKLFIFFSVYWMLPRCLWLANLNMERPSEHLVYFLLSALKKTSQIFKDLMLLTWWDLVLPHKFSVYNPDNLYDLFQVD